MKLFLSFIFSIIIVAVDALSKERVISLASVRLVKKNWRMGGFHPGTDDPLPGFPGVMEDLRDLITAYKDYDYESQPLGRAFELFYDSNYNSSQPSVIITHPLTIGDSAFIKYTIGVLSLRNLHKHYNIFAIHAPWLGFHFQLTCFQVLLGFKSLFEPMSEGFSSFLLDGIRIGKLRPDQISFIGFSYAATLNGYMARVIKSHTGQPVHTVLAVDAFAHNYNNIYFKQLSAEDASYVHIIHSSSMVGGTTARIATVDIVLNNGYEQPGCEGPFVPMGCSHRRSVPVLMYALIASGNIMGRACESWERFKQCKCSDELGYPKLIVSFPVNQEARGTFYVRTTSDLPFALGEYGTYCHEEVKFKEVSPIK